MPDNSNPPDWLHLSQELTQRVAKYSRIKANRNNSSQSPVPIKFDELASKDQAEDKPWWWPQIPVLKELLKIRDRSEPFATRVTLGKYGWDAEKDNSEIIWLNFLPEDSRDSENDLVDVLNFLKLDSQKTNESEKQLLVSSVLVDKINEEGIDNPPMLPLLLCFKDVPTNNGNDFLVADWHKFREKLENNREETHRSIQSYIQKATNLDFSPVEGFIDCTEWWKKQSDQEKKCFEKRLRGFIGWLHFMENAKNWEMLLTVPPIWHPKKLSGVHAVAIVVYVREDQWIAEFKNNHQQLRNEIGMFVSAFRSGSLVVFSEEVKEFYDAKQQAEKQAQMLDLMRRPLESLSQALAQTRADSQELRAILYEPWEAIFEAQPEIAKLFDPREQLNVGNKIIQIKHQPDSYESLEDAQFIFAEALRRFYGGHEVDVVRLWGSGETVLTVCIVALCDAMKKKNSSYHPLASRLCTVIGEKSWDEVKNNVACLTRIKGYLCNLKARFHRVYKPDAALESLHWYILQAYLPNSKVNLGTIKVNDSDVSNNNPIVLAKGSNPLSTLGHLVEFIVSVVAKHINDDPDIKIKTSIELKECPTRDQPGNSASPIPDDAKQVVLEFTSSKDWVDNMSGLNTLLLNQKELRKLKHREIGEHGDFHKPFVKLVQRIPNDKIEKFKLCCNETTSLKIKFPKLEVVFNQSSFKIESEKG